MSSWENLCDVGNLAQLAGVSAVGLIGLIAQAANSARLHKRNCRKFAHHLKLIGNLLEQLKISELKRYPETREPLEQLEDALRRAYVLVQSCQDKSYLYLLAMGWSIVNQFKRAQDEIDRYLKIMPLLTLVTNTRFKVVITVVLSFMCSIANWFTILFTLARFVQILAFMVVVFVRVKRIR